MSAFTIANQSAAFRPVPHTTKGLWVGISAAGRALHLSDEGVRHLVREGHLTCTVTPARHRMFLAQQVRDLAVKRANVHLVLMPTAEKARRSRRGAQQIPLFHVHHKLVQKAK